MEHVLKDYFVTDLQGVIKLPVADEVSTETTIPPDAIAMCLRVVFRSAFCSSDGWLVGHLKAIGHVACEGYVHDGRAYAMMLYDVYHGGGKVARLPCEGTAWLEDE